MTWCQKIFPKSIDLFFMIFNLKLFYERDKETRDGIYHEHKDMMIKLEIITIYIIQ